MLSPALPPLAWVAFCFLKERLLDLTVNSSQPTFRMSGTITKMCSLGLKLSGSLFGTVTLTE
jgi:hypothetical protein